jgi:hypothetical protein
VKKCGHPYGGERGTATSKFVKAEADNEYEQGFRRFSLSLSSPFTVSVLKARIPVYMSTRVPYYISAKKNVLFITVRMG